MSDVRPFRPRQKGVECSTEGCTDWCVSNDLCGKHNMAMRRYGSIQGKPETKRTCKNEKCGKEFKHKYDRAEYCSLKCYSSTDKAREKAYQALKRHRTKHPEKTRIRDRTGKRINRDKTLERMPCEVCKDENSEAHHYNYEHPLNINWLCKKHHVKLHKSIKEYEREWQTDFNLPKYKHDLFNKHFIKVQKDILKGLKVST